MPLAIGNDVPLLSGRHSVLNLRAASPYARLSFYLCIYARSEVDMLYPLYPQTDASIPCGADLYHPSSIELDTLHCIGCSAQYLSLVARKAG
ncbi:Uncharacterised protein [Vibrio cholerae]|uniref:Uncharacterized protein n=1 Tax=Vibrio cholerae TaxID=666 RepID=A0A655V7A2_VIBCL|nr:Uncharacterised protein [Vibrio cholerae]CSB62769.1 Uncharacterised protein [Vibrio cholerae]CSB65793.1 Uncharacterised protein [Vibrio cholerae]CSC67566.1 Uncharacterised protein [Vibrio cholerae]CSC97881.1 Uncharacterised protein [Vibrio cholerae]